MKRILQGVLTALAAVAMTLAAMFVLVRASMAVARMTNPILRAAAVTAELILGVLVLVGTVYVATRLAVRIFGGPPDAES